MSEYVCIVNTFEYVEYEVTLWAYIFLVPTLMTTSQRSCSLRIRFNSARVDLENKWEVTYKSQARKKFHAAKSGRGFWEWPNRHL